MNKPAKYSAEVRERAVRMVLDHQDEYDSQWVAIQSIAQKIGCAGETLRSWVRQTERDRGKRAGLSTDERSIPSMQKRREPVTTWQLLSRAGWTCSGSAGRVRRVERLHSQDRAICVRCGLHEDRALSGAGVNDLAA